jgi:hypothetical protein
MASGVKSAGFAATCGGKASSRIGGGLLLREKRQTGVNHDALAQLAKRGQTKLVIEFGLSRKNDLKEFTARSLEIEEQAKFVESLLRQCLSFVENQDRQSPRDITRHKPVVQSSNEIAFLQRNATYAEIAQNELQ